MCQLTLDFEPALPERWPTLREYVAFLSLSTAKPMKAQAADMDMAPSTLSRKMNPTEGDTQRFNLDDLEGWIDSTGEGPRVVAYLAAKYMDSDESKCTRLLANAEQLISELSKVLPQLQGAST